MGRAETNWTGVALGVWLGVLAAFQQFKLPPALPLLLDRYGYDTLLAGGFMSVYAVAGLLLSLHLGRAMQRHGAGVFLAAGFGLFAIGDLLMLLSPASGAIVLLGRGLEGVGFIILAILCSVFANLSIAPRHLPIAAALVATWIPAGQLIATLAAAPFLAHQLWAPLWWIGLVATLMTALWAWWLERSGRISFRLAPPAAAGPAAGRAMSRRERNALLLTAATFMLWATQLFAFLTWTPEFLVSEHGVAPADAALIFGVPVLVLLIGNMIGGAILRAGAPLPALMLTVIVGQSFFWFLLPQVKANPGGLAVLIIYGLIAGITPTCLYAAPATILGTARAGGRAFGLLHLGRSAGVLVGPLLMAAIFDRLGSWPATAPVFAAVTLAAGVAAAGLIVQMRPYGSSL